MHRIVSWTGLQCCDLACPYCLPSRYLLNNSLAGLPNSSLCAEMPKLSWL